MRICLVVDNLNESAGWGRLAKNLRDALVASGNTVSFIARSGEVPGAKTLHAHMREVSILNLRALLRSIVAIRQWASRHDVVICLDLNPYGIIVASALLFSRTRFVLYCLGSYSLPTKSHVRNALMRFALWRADKTLVVSEFLRLEIKKGGFDLRDVQVLPVGVDPNFFHRVTEEPKFAGRYILGVGGIKYRKGFHLSLEAFGLVASKYTDVSYIIVGHTDKDDYYRRLVAQAQSLGIADRVRFVDHLTDEELRNAYSCAECFVLTPVTTDNALEGFGMVYLEAALCGLASVGTKGSGAAEAIEDEVTGLLAEPIPEKIAESLERILSDVGFRSRLSGKATTRARDYGWDAIALRLKTILGDLV